MAHLHLIIGPVGAGKSTLARRLAASHGAVPLIEDDWFVTCMLPDRPAEPPQGWYAERTARCRAQLLDLAEALLRRGASVAVEVALLGHEAQQAVLGRFVAFPTTLWVVDAAPETRRRRVLLRNAAPEPGIVVSEAAFTRASEAWQPPSTAQDTPWEVVHLHTDTQDPNAPLPPWQTGWSPAPQVEDAEDLPPMVVAYPAERVARFTTTAGMTRDAVDTFALACRRAQAELDAGPEPWAAILDARRKSFVSLDAQRAMSALWPTSSERPKEVLVVAAPGAPVARDGATACATFEQAWARACGPRTQAWPSVALLTGGTGAGKSTTSRWAAVHHGALPLAIDAWMSALFGPDTSEGFDWFMARITRIESLLQQVCPPMLAAGVPLCLDLGFTTRAHRERWLRWAASVGERARVVHVKVPAAVRWARVQARNAARGPTWRMHVSREMFDFMEQRWEAPTAAEGPPMWVF